MSTPIEDYALISDCETGALVSRSGSIDWLCVPRFDSEACFAALLGKPEHGRWLVAPKGEVRETRRRYRNGSLVLETVFTTDDGEVALIDFMEPRLKNPELIRLVVGRRGKVRMQTELVVRFDYGQLVPWVRKSKERLMAVAGPQTLHLDTPVELEGKNFHTVAEFDVAEGERVPMVMLCSPSHEPPPDPVDAEESLRRTEAWWKEWSNQCGCEGPYRHAVQTSLAVLKGLTYAPTGGITAALTTSLPEDIGGSKNWDYRYCWIRDATFVLYALTKAGHTEEAKAWRDWLHRAVAGKPSQIQTVYGVAGERRLLEFELDWLPGYEGSRPVRVGNAAYQQIQLDVYGEIMDAMHLMRRAGLHPDPSVWNLQKRLLGHMESIWKEPDQSIWEFRGQRRQYTYSKVMAWVAMDRAVKAVERFHLKGHVERWRQTRDEIHQQVCREAFNEKLNSFVQYYGGDELDASVMIIPLVGFLPHDDPRVRGTVDAIQKHLTEDGLVLRYRDQSPDGATKPGEGVFLLCSFWLVDNLAMIGRRDEARELFERLLGLCNDVGLLPEEYDIARGRFVGNFPQAFSHVALINSAFNLQPDDGPSADRARS